MIEVFADVTCPFTHVGLQRVVAERSAAGSTMPIRLKAWPLEIVNGEPQAGDFVGQEVTALRASVTSELFRGFDPDRFPTTTLPALGLTTLAYGRSLELGEAVGLAVRDALFEHGLDIGKAAVLRDIATAHDLDPAEIDPEAPLAEYAEGIERGVVGSPYFIVDGQGFFCPSLDIKNVNGHFEITADPGAFTAFMAAALAGSES